MTDVLVDTGSDYTWLPEAVLKRIGVREQKRDLEFVMANGQTITRSVGFAIIRVNGHFTIDELVFARVGDLSLLGARTLEGLNVRVDSKSKRLVDGGPLTAAGTLHLKSVLQSENPGFLAIIERSRTQSPA